MAHNASGQGWLIPMVDPVAGACGETPEQVPAYANYSSERELEERDIDGHLAPAGEGKAAVADPEPHPEKARIAETLASPEGRRRHARRKWMAEATAGWIKQATGFRRLSFRGPKKLEAEWILLCLALNVRRLHTLRAARADESLSPNPGREGPQHLSRPRRTRRRISRSLHDANPRPLMIPIRQLPAAAMPIPPRRPRFRGASS